MQLGTTAVDNTTRNGSDNQTCQSVLQTIAVTTVSTGGDDASQSITMCCDFLQTYMHQTNNKVP